jgi:hypothetical protein
MNKMRFTLTVEYELPSEAINDVEKAHMEVFEDSPGDFINYILSKESTYAEYEFENQAESKIGDVSEGFDCDHYFYDKTVNANLCLKYGALCSTVFCRHLNK